MRTDYAYDARCQVRALQHGASPVGKQEGSPDHQRNGRRGQDAPAHSLAERPHARRTSTSCEGSTSAQVSKITCSHWFVGSRTFLILTDLFFSRTSMCTLDFFGQRLESSVHPFLQKFSRHCLSVVSCPLPLVFGVWH